MPGFSALTSTWSDAFAVDVDSIIQARDNPVIFSLNQQEADPIGILLNTDETMTIPAGKKIRAKTEATSARLSIERISAAPGWITIALSASSIAPGEDFTFVVATESSTEVSSATANIGGTNIPLTDNGNGSYTGTSPNVSGSITITVTGTDGDANAVTATSVVAVLAPTMTLTISPAAPAKGDTVTVLAEVSGSNDTDFFTFSVMLNGVAVDVTTISGFQRSFVASDYGDYTITATLQALPAGISKVVEIASPSLILSYSDSTPTVGDTITVTGSMDGETPGDFNSFTATIDGLAQTVSTTGTDLQRTIAITAAGTMVVSASVASPASSAQDLITVSEAS